MAILLMSQILMVNLVFILILNGSYINLIVLKNLNLRELENVAFVTAFQVNLFSFMIHILLVENIVNSFALYKIKTIKFIFLEFFCFKITLFL